MPQNVPVAVALMVVSSSRPHYPIDVPKQASNEKVSPATEPELVAVSELGVVLEPATEPTKEGE